MKGKDWDPWLRKLKPRKQAKQPIKFPNAVIVWLGFPPSPELCLGGWRGTFAFHAFPESVEL